MNEMKSAAGVNLKHAGLAYLVLGLLLWLAWLLLFSPLKLQWHQHKQHSSELRLEVERLAAQGEHNQRSMTDLEKLAQSLVDQHVLAGPASASIAGHQLQTRVKQALQAASATVAEIRPRSAAVSEWMNQSQLDVSFRIPAAELETLFAVFAQQSPAVHIELLSLRAPTVRDAELPQLEARVTLSSWNLSESLSEPFAELTPSTDNPAGDSAAVAMRAELAGLFDAALREKLRNPSTEHYRLSAVTLSANARIAIIADLQSGASRRMQEGDVLDGWEIKKIDSTAVKLQSGEKQATLRLQQE